ncbi:MAG: prepilin-type N-terminal cleavage/methylation domain-containing protein [Candidatus Omnitrophota bacterium]
MKNKKGFTLIEAVVSMLLLGIAVVSMIAALTQTSIFSESVNRAYAVSYLAQRRVDLLKRLDFDLLSSSAENSVRVGIDGNEDPNGAYVRTTEITTNFDDNPCLTKVKVTSRRAKVNADGSILNSATNEITFTGAPVVMETLFSDVR